MTTRSTNDEDLRVRPCMRSGACCKVATCAVGVAFGAPQVGCTYLSAGPRPGEYTCTLVEQYPELREDLAIGAGCCMPLFNDAREELIRRYGSGVQKPHTTLGPQ